MTSSSFSMMDPTDEAIFTAGLDDVTTMSRILHEVHHADDHSVLEITQDGIRIITAVGKTFQVSAFFAASAFQRYKFDYDNYNRIHFRFMLRDFIESLNLLRDDPIVEGDKVLQQDEREEQDLIKTSLYIQYRKKGSPLKLRLENKSNYVINCDLNAFNSASDQWFQPLAFTDFEEHAMIVLNSRKFYEYVSGLDLVLSANVHLVMSRGEVPLKLSTKSTELGEAELEITHNEIEIIKKEIVVTDNCLFSFNYKTQFIKPALDALRASNFIRMKCSSNGLLCIEHFHEDISDLNSTLDCAFLRQKNDNFMSSTQNAIDITTDFNQPQRKRSSVEYFILSEARPIDACPF